MKTSRSSSQTTLSVIKKLLPDLKRFREDLHQHPELSWQEFRTTEKIIEFLKKFGIEEFHRPIETGGWVDFVFQEDAPFIMLRADIDALPLQDSKTVPYRSKNPGVCHACGHDVHTTIMVGVAAAIHQLQLILPHNIRVVFQPAEEPIPAGAPKFMEHGVLNGVKYALSQHVDPRLPLGIISLTSGWVNMQSVRLDLKLKGAGGHSARPFETADLIWLASRLVDESYGIIYREFNWLEHPVVLTFTEIHAGEGYNIIPRELTLTGTLRVTSRSSKNRFLMKFRTLLQQLETENGVQAEFTRVEGAPPVLNDENLIRQLQEIARTAEPSPITFISDFRSSGGDDFGYYAQEVPSALVRFGIKTKDDQPPLHNGHFDVPFEVVELAIRFFLEAIQRLK
ncbi:MAG: amidohydrolase [Calditrichaeota bacterium]|nr:amidohydrolase [Calditrichota bacterium]